MSTNVHSFKWNSIKLQAAELLAEDKLSNRKIAEQLDIDEKTLRRWLAVPEFSQKVEELVAEIEERIISRGLARRARRIESLKRMLARMEAVIEARGKDPEHQKAPGGDQGIQVRTIKGTGGGDNFVRVEEYEVDTGLLKEYREYQKQLAQEKGDWTEKHEHSGEIVKVYIGGDPAAEV